MEEDGAEIVVCANEFGIDSIDVFHPEKHYLFKQSWFTPAKSIAVHWNIFGGERWIRLLIILKLCVLELTQK